MLHPAKVKIFALMSVAMHVAFAVLFAEITLSFTPPVVKKLSLTIMTRESARGEIIQSEAAWPMPARSEPDFSPDATMQEFGSEATQWIDFRKPDPSLFEQDETLIPVIDLKNLAAKAYEPPPNELYAHPSPELKTMPVTDLALGPAVPEIFGHE